MKNLYLIFLTLAFCFSSQTGTAQWYRGAEISCRHIALNDYEINMYIYRDCAAVPLPNNVTLNITCASNSALNFNTTLLKVPGNEIEITRPCTGTFTKCSSSSGINPGVQSGLYRMVVTLPPCGNWTIVWGYCCRPYLNSLSNSGSYSMYHAITLNNADAPGAGSPVFVSPPEFILFTNRTNSFSVKANDPNGDSISYHLVTPKGGANITLQWIPGLSANQPFDAASPLSIDPVTGIITTTPINVCPNFSTVLTVEVRKWRKINNIPVLVGTTLREQVLFFRDNPNSLPVLGGIEFTPTAGYDSLNTNYTVTACKNGSLDFYIFGYDADNPQSQAGKFKINADNSLPGLSLTAYNNGTCSAYAHVNWIPDSNVLSGDEFFFNATIVDDGCSFNGFRTFGYCIKIIDSHNVNIGNDLSLCLGESKTIYAAADTASDRFIWKLNGSILPLSSSSDSIVINTTLLNEGIYILSVEAGNAGTIGSCPAKDSITLEIYDFQKIFGKINGPNVVVQNTDVQYTANTAPSTSRIWKTLGGTILSGANSDTVLVRWNSIGYGLLSIEALINDVCYAFDTLLLTITTGTDDIISVATDAYRIYPHPVVDVSVLEISEILFTPGMKIQLYNAFGQLILAERLEDRFYSLPANICNSLCFFKVYSEKRVISGRFLVRQE